MKPFRSEGGTMLEHLKQEATLIRSVDDFKEWTRTSLRRVFPHLTLGCGYGRIHAGGVAIDGIIAIDYPVMLAGSIRLSCGAGWQHVSRSCSRPARRGRMCRLSG